MTELPINLGIKQVKRGEKIYACISLHSKDCEMEIVPNVPNRWNRFWYWFLLGCTWEKV